MKALLIIISSILAIASCGKGDAAGPGVLGKWIVTESYADPGDGSGTWKKHGKPYDYYLFKSDSTVEIGTEGKADKQTIRFSVLDSNRVKFAFAQNPLIYGYTLKNNRLTLHPPCIEGCGMRLERP
jgi:hypothetical protein